MCVHVRLLFIIEMRGSRGVPGNPGNLLLRISRVTNTGEWTQPDIIDITRPDDKFKISQTSIRLKEGWVCL